MEIIDREYWEGMLCDAHLEIARLRKVVTELANASQSEATSRLRQMAKVALDGVSNGDRE